MNKGYSFSDMVEIKRIISQHISGGLLLSCGHTVYFGNPEDFKIGNLFECYDCSCDEIKFRIAQKPEINVSNNLQVNGQHLKDDKWSNN